jgi:phosphoglycerate dehydrogenase-like enzyme
VKSLCILDADACRWTYGSEVLRELRAATTLLAEPFTSHELAAHPAQLAEVEVLFTGWGAPRMDERFLAAAPHLRAVFYAGGSVRPFVTEAFWTREVLLCNAGVQNAIPTAEFATAAIQLSLKHTWRYLRRVRAQRAFPELEEMPGGYGSIVGLVSFGAVGREVARRLRGTDLRVVTWDPLVSATDAATAGVELVPLPELFAQSDVVSLHAPLLPQTRGFVGAQLLRSMKRGATLVNTARGGLIVEMDLIDTLRGRPDLTAFLDVTDPEPPAADSALYTLENVFVTPHLAGSRFHECRRLGHAMLDEFQRWRRGEPLQLQLHPHRAANLA